MDENKPAARAPVATIAATGALAVAFLSTGTAFPQADDPSGKLSIWTGRWAYRVQNYNTPFGRSSTYDGTADCSWSANTGFVVCDFLNHNPPPGFPRNDLGIISYDARTKTYSHIGAFKEASR